MSNQVETYGYRYATGLDEGPRLGEEECQRITDLLFEWWEKHKGMKTVFGVDPRLEISRCMSENLMAEMPKSLETLTEAEQHRVRVLVNIMSNVWVRIVMKLMDEEVR